MNKIYLILIACAMSSTCYAQIEFEKGYYIDNGNQKINCSIKNIDWQDNPSAFTYRLSNNDDPKQISIESVKEFGIDKVSKYIRRTIKMDKSSEVIVNMSRERAPVFEEEQIFLKVLIEGTASLYRYRNGNLERYFYSKENSEIEQLVFKKYLTNDGDIALNNNYKQILSQNLKCPSIKISQFENLNYKRNKLINLFVAYNNCINQDFTNFDDKKDRDLFNLNLRPGINFSSLSIVNSVSDSRDADFGSKVGFRLGVEAEFIMPFHKNKWSIVVEPTYQVFKASKELPTQNATADYKSIELPIGIRHYFFLNEDSKIFVNGSYVFDFSGNSIIEFENNDDLPIESKSNIAFGLGYNHNSKYSLELRYHTSREILNNFVFWSSEYNTISLIFGYSIF